MVNEAGEPVSLVDDIGYGVAMGTDGPFGMALQHLGVGADDGQWGAELVRSISHEGVLRLHSEADGLQRPR